MTQPMKKVFLLAVMLFGAAAVIATEAPASPPFPLEDADIWVLAGQSNMEGYGRIRKEYVANPRIAVFNLRNEWKPAVPPTHTVTAAAAPVFKKLIFEINPTLTEKDWAHWVESQKDRPIGGVGPDLSFAESIVSATGRNVVLLPCALGGTSLSHWNPARRDEGEASLYGNMLARIKKVGGRVKGVLWYQGESQANRAAAETFEKDFLNFVDNVRRDVGDPELPFLYVQIGRFCYENHDSEPFWKSVQEKQRIVRTQRPNLWVVPAVDLPLDDMIHVGAAGQERLGRRLAEVALTHIYQVAGHGTPLDFVSCAVLPDTDVSHHSLRVKFSGVTGRLQSQGRPAGFELQSDEPNRDGPTVYNVELDPTDSAAVIVWYSKELRAPAKLSYALGMDRYANLTDERDMAVPAFGPIVIDPRK
jgi:sialate O-acetylesterase